MALTRLQLGELYVTKGGALERKFIGCILDHCLQIRGGGYADPNANQLAFADYAHGCTQAEKSRLAREVMEWGLVNNHDLQQQGENLNDGALSWITAEYTKTWTASGGE
jgi:hypothetical protein